MEATLSAPADKPTTESRPLRTMTPQQLEREANRLLGHRMAERRGVKPMVFTLHGGRKLYKPTLNTSPPYMPPKKQVPGLVCCDCERPRSYSSAKRCRACYAADRALHYLSNVSSMESLVGATAGFEGDFDNGTWRRIRSVEFVDPFESDSETIA